MSQNDFEKGLKMSNSNYSANSTNQTDGNTNINIAILSCYIFVDACAFVGNVLVCLAVYRSVSLRTITNMFMVSLAVTDLLMAVLVMPFSVAESMGETWQDVYFSCQYYGYVGYTLGGVSVLTLTLVAVNRYICVARPILYKNLYTKQNSLIMIACTWAITVIFLFGFGWLLVKMEFHFHDNVCVPRFQSPYWDIFVSLASLFFIIAPSLVITVCYARVFCIVRHHSMAVAANLQQSGNTAPNVREAKFTNIFVFVLVAYFVCWLPPFIWHVLLYTGRITTEKFVDGDDYTIILPVYLNSAVNPVIYAAMSKQFRKEFASIVCCCLSSD